MPPQNERFPSALQAFLLIVALFLVEYLVSAAVYDMQGILRMTPAQFDAIVSVLANGCLFSLVMHVKRLGWRDLFHPSSASPRATFALLVVPVAMLVPALVLIVSALLDALLDVVPMSAREEAMFARMAADSLASVTVTCVIAPVVEEMLFRGVILRSFLTQYSRRTAILGSAVLFGFAHLNIYQFVVGVILGSLAGWLYERTRSLIPCIALHASYNSALTALDWLARTHTSTLAEPSSVFTWVGSLLLAALSSLMLTRMLHRSPQRS